MTLYYEVLNASPDVKPYVPTLPELWVLLEPL